jgi:hypothetical protein
MKETKTVDEYLVPFSTELKTGWFTTGAAPPSKAVRPRVHSLPSSYMFVIIDDRARSSRPLSRPTVTLRVKTATRMWHTQIIPGLRPTSLLLVNVAPPHRSFLHSSRPSSPINAWGFDTRATPSLLGSSPTSSRCPSPTIVRVKEEFALAWRSLI